MYTNFLNHRGSANFKEWIDVQIMFSKQNVNKFKNKQKVRPPKISQ